MTRFEGGDGSSIENAVKIIGASGSMQGIRAEYEYLAGKFGIRGRDWELVMQSLLNDGGKDYDLMRVRLKDGTEITVFFDITDFFGKL